MQTLLDTFPQMKWYQKIVVFIVFAIWLGITYTETPNFIVDWSINYNAFNSIPALFGFGMSVFVLFAVIPFVAVICAYIVEFPVWLVNKLLIAPVKFILNKGSKNATL
jgi:hypothetical protein